MHRLTPEKIRNFWASSPPEILASLLRVTKRRGVRLFLVGGTVRDWLLGRATNDLDIAAAGPVRPLAELLRQELGGGALVDLSATDDEVIRVVWHGEQIDFSSFRAGVPTIEEDLSLRDFTLNALAVPLTPDKAAVEILDPNGGLADLQARRIRHCPGAFAADPVRMLRGFRLAATLDFVIEPETAAEIREKAHLIGRVAAERITYEMRIIFGSDRTAETLTAMDQSGLLRLLLPELYEGEGVEQPEFHHLDVLGHSFLALEMMEKIIAEPGSFFAGDEAITRYLEEENAKVSLKWAALLHDIGKPATREFPPEGQGRVTFYRHDEVGREIFQRFAERCRWSNADTERTGGLIAMHMHPFHLCNLQLERGRITRRAAVKLCRRAGRDLPGLFLLAMADSLASKGEKKPERMEEELTLLYETVRQTYLEFIEPVLRGPRLITGRDLIEQFDLTPGPLFTELLAELEIARVEGAVVDRQTALSWVAEYLRHDRDERPV